MFLFCKVSITRKDPFSRNECINDSSYTDDTNIYKQAMEANYSTIVSVKSHKLAELELAIKKLCRKQYVHFKKWSLKLSHTVSIISHLGALFSFVFDYYYYYYRFV